MSSSFNTAIKSVTWILAVIAVGTVAFRLYLRRKFNVTCTAEEWLMVAAVIFHIVFQACVTLQCDYGLGLPLQAMSMDQIIQLSKWIWISATFSNIASVLARISITVMLVRIFGTRKWFKMLMISFTTIQGVLAVVNVICIWAQATPVEGLWDQRVRQSIWNPMIQQVIATILQGESLPSDFSSYFQRLTTFLDRSFCHQWPTICLISGHVHLEAQHASPSKSQLDHPHGHVRYHYVRCARKNCHQWYILGRGNYEPGYIRCLCCNHSLHDYRASTGDYYRLRTNSSTNCETRLFMGTICQRLSY